MTGRSYWIAHWTGAGPNPHASTTYYHGDHLGSSRMMTGYNGYPVWQATYLPFGQEWNPQATVNHYKFTGKERDAESGLDYFGARYYASLAGRFSSTDPVIVTPDRLGDPQQFNLYAYTRNNPLRFIDPTGMVLTLSGDIQKGLANLCEIADISCGSMRYDSKTNTITIEIDEYEYENLNQNEGLLMLMNLSHSANRYDLFFGSKVDTKAGQLQIDGNANLDNEPDSRYPGAKPDSFNLSQA